MSDFNGNLLFYCDGKAVYNRLNQIMPNGAGLDGGLLNQSSGVMIIPFADVSDKYYVFNSQGRSIAEVAELGYTYNIVDMSLNGGLGDVTAKNIRIGNHNSSGKIAAAAHSNGVDVWLITRDRLNNYYSVKVKCDGIDPVPSITTIGYNPNNPPSTEGVMKASPDGKLLAVAFIESFELFRINQDDGTLYDRVELDFRFPFGVEFSPDSRYVYATSEKREQDNQYAEVLQFDLSVYDSSSIQNSKVVISSRIGEYAILNHMQLGPDGKIYKAVVGERWLDVIDKPLLAGTACNFIPRGINLGPFPNLGTLPFAPPFIFQNPNVQLSYAVAPDCRTVNFTGKTYIKGQNLTFTWIFGDGVTETQTIASGGDTSFASITHFYPPGTDTFELTLLVSSDGVCGQGRIGKQVIVKPPRPKAIFGYQTICGSSSVSFSDSSLLNFNPSITYRWEFLDKDGALLSSSTLQNPGFAYPSVDTVSARLIVSSSLSCVLSDTMEKTIVLKARPSASFTVAETCGSLIASFSNTSSLAAGSIVRHHWDFGDGNSSSAPEPVHAFASFGSYDIKLVVESGAGCLSDTASQTLTIRAKPQASIIYNNDACESQAFTLSSTASAEASTILDHYWRILPTAQVFTTPGIEPSLPAGSYAIQYVAVSALGCPSDTVQRQITVESLPSLTLGDTIGCTGTPLSLPAALLQPIGTIASYNWQAGSLSSPEPSPFFTFASPGSYPVQLTVESLNGCTATASATVGIEAIPQPLFSYTPPCLGTEVQFNNGTANAANYAWQWTVNGSEVAQTSSFAYVFTAPGEYSVLLTGRSPNGCSAAALQSVKVQDFSLSLSASQNPAYEGDELRLNSNATLPYTVIGWQPEALFAQQSALSQQFLADSTRLYQVVGEAGGGCRDTASLLLEVKPLDDIYIPSAFSPNGDGRNELLRVVGSGIGDFHFIIYNRWGGVVYQSRNKSEGWNGLFNGQPAMSGTYIYLLQATKQSGAKIIRKGTVTLLR
ncbi:MAG TPA: PKD domain-containing protein [Flavisolibacter sp.]|nr:PKD domain-containing protein [Flavisolibacter sp.]